MITLKSAQKGDYVIAFTQSGGGTTGGRGFRAVVRVDLSDTAHLFVYGAVFDRTGRHVYGKFGHADYEDSLRRGGGTVVRLAALEAADALSFKAEHMRRFLGKFSVWDTERGVEISAADAALIEAMFKAGNFDDDDALRGAMR